MSESNGEIKDKGKTTKTVIVDTDLTRPYGFHSPGRTDESVVQTLERVEREEKGGEMVEVENRITTEPFPPSTQVMGLLIIWSVSIIFLLAISKSFDFLIVSVLTTTMALGGLLRYIIVEKNPLNASVTIVYLILNTILMLESYGLNVNARFDEITTIFVVVMVFALFFQTQEKFIVLASLPIIGWLMYKWYLRGDFNNLFN